MLRKSLSSYTGIPAECISFVYGSTGKPALAEQRGSYDIRFNLSHSGGLVVCVVAAFPKTMGREVGIDVERIDRRLAGNAIAELYFSANEKALLRAASAERAAEVFFTCWTRKEACVKATGVGAAQILPELDLPAPPASSVCCGGTQWTLLSFKPAPGYVAAVALENKEGVGVHLHLSEYKMAIPKTGFAFAREEDRGNRAIYAGF
jgi:4'-phosphopantetheinyl transferase